MDQQNRWTDAILILLGLGVFLGSAYVTYLCVPFFVHKEYSPGSKPLQCYVCETSTILDLLTAQFTVESDCFNNPQNKIQCALGEYCGSISYQSNGYKQIKRSCTKATGNQSSGCEKRNRHGVSEKRCICNYNGCMHQH